MTKIDLTEARENEWAYYRDLYKNHKYGGPKNRRLIRHQVTDRVIQRYGLGDARKKWLDVGAGAYKPRLPPTCMEHIRTDPGNERVKDSYAIHQLVEAYGRESFDVVCSFDVLEHLLPEELEEGIQALWDVCRVGGRIIVSMGTDVGGPWNGRATHLTQEPTSWWKSLLEMVCGTTARHVDTAKGTSPFFVIERI